MKTNFPHEDYFVLPWYQLFVFISKRHWENMCFKLLSPDQPCVTLRLGWEGFFIRSILLILSVISSSWEDIPSNDTSARGLQYWSTSTAPTAGDETIEDCKNTWLNTTFLYGFVINGLSMDFNANGGAIIGLQKPQWREKRPLFFFSPNTHYYDYYMYG